MISLMKRNKNNGALYLCGLSTDTKPTDVFYENSSGYKVANASVYNCIDTGDIYTFDETGKSWNLTGSGGGGQIFDDDVTNAVFYIE